MTVATQLASTYRVGRNGRRRDAVFVTVLSLAFIVSVIAFAITYSNGHVLTYNDAISHQMIARRTILGYQSGAAQLGSVWPMLTHILMLPLVASDFLYYSGIAGAVISMVAFVASVGFVYKILHKLTGSRVAGVTAAVIFAANVNILYMQSTPMTELPLYATLLGGVYFLQVWADERKYQCLVAAAFSLMCATHIRYESWVILAVLTVVVAITAWRERLHGVSGKARRGRWWDLMIPFLVASAGGGPMVWFFWNKILFGSWTAFMGGEYAKPALWLTNSEPAIGNIGLSLKTFWYATIENVPWPLLIVAVVGLIGFYLIEVVKGKAHGRSLIVPSLLAIIPFFVYAIYTGERPLHTIQTNGSLYNVRFGLIMVLPVALFAGYAIGILRKFTVVKVLAAAAVMAVAVGAAITSLNSNHVITLNDPVAALKEDRAVWAQEVIDDFKPIYQQRPGITLVETFGNERLAFSLVPSQQMIYEGTNKGDRWKNSLANPAGNDIQWIIMRCIPGYRDKVCDALENNSAALADYDLVYTKQTAVAVGYKIYRKR